MGFLLLPTIAVGATVVLLLAERLLSRLVAAAGTVGAIVDGDDGDTGTHRERGRS